MALRRILRRWPYALVGIVAAAVGMAVGHVVAGLVQPAASPVLAVGSNVIDATPTSLKTWAIRRFGSNDKAVLLSSVTAVTLLLAVVAGVASRRRRWIGVGFVVALGGLSLLAAVRTPATASTPGAVPGATVLPALTAMVATGAALLGLRRLALAGDPHDVVAEPEAAEPEAAEPRPEHPTDHAADGSHPGRTGRRSFLVGAAGATGGAALLGVVGQKLTAPKPVGDLPELTISSKAPPLPASLDRTVPGIAPFRTPTGKFYRVDTALVLPRVDRGSWTLTIDGDVDEPLELTFEDLLKLPVIERDLTLNCVSNEVGGPYISSGRWLGVRTRDLLARAGVGRGVDQILSRSADGMTISTPLQALTDGRDSMVAFGLNGEALPRARGYPARLLTPGLYGFVGATKWLTTLTATTYAERQAYWTKRDWAIDGRVKTQSRIDTPRGFDRVALGPVVVGGVAWAQRRGIRRVEVQVDDGPWQEAVLGPEANIDYWRQWYFRWTVTEPGRHDLRVRATDGTGQLQTEERRPPFPNGASGLASLSVTAE